MTRVAVLGSSGFVGRAVVEALPRHNAVVTTVKSPRLHQEPAARAKARLLAELAAVDVVVNAAGAPNATGGSSPEMTAANAELPSLLAAVAASLGARLVHVSSAAVQGDMPVLDSSTSTRPLSPYAQSKSQGEAAVLKSSCASVVYRPSGVHAADRRVTQQIARIARSPFATVAGTGDDPTAQAQLANVADAVAFLATVEDVPRVVHHPSEGLTTGQLLTLLSGRTPRRLPRGLCRQIVQAGHGLARRGPGPLEGHVRRVEMLWFGQRQATSWLTDVGWNPVTDHSGWVTMGDEIRRQKETS